MEGQEFQIGVARERSGGRVSKGPDGAARARSGVEALVKDGVGVGTGGGTPDRGWGSSHGVGFQSGDGIPDMG